MSLSSSDTWICVGLSVKSKTESRSIIEKLSVQFPLMKLPVQPESRRKRPSDPCPSQERQVAKRIIAVIEATGLDCLPPNSSRKVGAKLGLCVLET